MLHGLHLQKTPNRGERGHGPPLMDRLWMLRVLCTLLLLTQLTAATNTTTQPAARYA
jgi:hypothetical protein